MNISCSNQDPCPVILDSKCVIYEGENLLYIGVNNNDNYRTALQNINEVIGNLILLSGITQLTGDVTAFGPGVAAATLATVNSTPGQYGSSTAIPKVTVDGKGRVTAITTEAVFIPSGALSFIGDVTGTGNTGSDTTLTLATVNSNVYTTNNFLKFAVNGKGLITSATPVTSSDIISTLGYTPYNATNPAGYISGITGSMVVTALGYTPYDAANPANYISRAQLSAVTPLAYNSTTGEFTIQQGGSAQSGYISSTDWNTFNSKEPAIVAGTTAQYWRGDKTWQTLDTSVVPENTNLYYTQTRFNTAFSAKTTSDLTEGTNLYYTEARVSANTDVAANTAARHAAVTLGTANGLGLVGQQLSLALAGPSATGALSSTDWSTFNSKQAAGNYITGLTGEATASGPGVASVTLSDAAVVAKVLTGLNITGGSVVDTDSLLIAIGKIQNQLNSLYGGVQYQGIWNASTNTPTLTSGVGIKGHYYIVSVPGTTNLDGITDWNLGDWAIYDGTAWQQVDNTDAVVSVNGQTGAVSLTTDNIPEGLTNQYFLNSRARLALSGGTGISYDNITGIITNSAPDQLVSIASGAGISVTGTYPNFTIASTITQYTDALARQAISLTTTGTSGLATYDNITGILNIPNYGSVLTGYVPYTGATGNIDLGEYGIKNGYVQFDLTPTGTPTTQGTMSWNADKNSLDLIMNGVTGSLMQDSFFNVKNQTGASIPKGTVVRANGTVGASGRILIAPFLADGTFDSKFCIGVTAETIANGADGKVTAFGAIRKINTSAFPNGTILYASPTTAGAFTSTEPSNPNNIVTVAIVIYSDNINGEIFVRPTFVASETDIIKSLGYTPADDSLVVKLAGTQTITGAKTFNALSYFNDSARFLKGAAFLKGNTPSFGLTQTDVFIFSNTGDKNLVIQDIAGESAKLQFQNTGTQVYTFPASSGTVALTSDLSNYVTLTGIQSITGEKTFSNNTLKLAGSGGGLNTFLSNTGGTGVTSLGANLLGFNVNNDLYFAGGSKGGGVFVFNNSAVRNYTLQNASGTLAFTSDIPSLAGYVPTSRTLTINGTTYDLSADRSWTIAAGVTSFNTRTGAITLLDTDVTSALGYTPVTNTRTLTINGVTYDLTADRSWTVSPNINSSTTQDYTATAGQTVFTVTGGYTVGQLSVYYNGSKLSSSEYTATNGTSFTLTTPAQLNDVLQAVASVTGGGIGGSGTTNTLPKFTGTSAIGNSNITDTGSLITLGSNSYVNGGLGIGTSSLNGRNLLINRTLTGTTVSISVFNISTIASDVTNTASSFRSSPSTQAASFTLASLNHFQATNVTIGSGNTVTTQVGYVAGTLSSATNNYGFQGQLVAATNSWNLYMSGTAANYMAGKLLIGSTTDSGELLQVNGTSKFTGAATFSSSVTAGSNILINNSGTTIPNIGATSSQGGLNLYSGATADYNGGGQITLVSSDRSGAYTRGEIYISAGRATNNTSNGFIALSTSDTERMRITSGGDLGINSSNTFGWRLRVVGSSTTNSSFGAEVVAGTSNLDTAFAVRSYSDTPLFQVRGDGLLISRPLISTHTTSSGANIYVDPSNGAIYRSTSSLKYKKNVEDYTKGLDVVMQLRPVTYEGKNEIDNGRTFAGLIAEEVHELGLTEYVQYAEDGTPDALAYQNMVALAFKAIQEQQAQIEELKARLN